MIIDFPVHSSINQQPKICHVYSSSFYRRIADKATVWQCNPPYRAAYIIEIWYRFGRFALRCYVTDCDLIQIKSVGFFCVCCDWNVLVQNNYTSMIQVSRDKEISVNVVFFLHFLYIRLGRASISYAV